MGENMDMNVPGSIQKAGKVVLFVPSVYDVRTGNNMGEPDDCQIWLNGNPPSFFNYYWIILKDSEESADTSISMTKSLNGGEDIPEFEMESGTWSGVRYVYNDIPCNVLKGKSADAVFQVTIIGHEIDSDETKAVLNSVKRA